MVIPLYNIMSSFLSFLPFYGRKICIPYVCAKRLGWWTLVITSKVLRPNHNLIDCYGISVSQMTTEKFQLSQTLLGPFLVHHLSKNTN